MKYLVFLIVGMVSFKAGAQSSALSVADSLAAIGNYSKAISTYQTVHRQDARILYKIAKSYRSLGNASKALAYYKQSLEISPEQLLAATEYGRLLYSQRRFESADSIFRVLANKYPFNPEFHYQRGRTIKALGPNMKYIAGDTMGFNYVNAFAKAVSLDSTHQKAIYALGEYYLKQRDYPQVTELANKGLESDPESVEMMSLHAQNYYNRGFHDDAIIWFEKLIEKGQSTAFIHEKLGKSYYQQGLPELAIDQYAILMDRFRMDKDPAIHIALARLFQRTGDFQNAIRHGEIALALNDPALDEEYFTLATIYRIHKKFKEALEHYQRAIAENPKHFEAHYGLAVAADNYYEDKKQVLTLYERFVSKFEKKPKNQYTIRLANARIKILKSEIFMAEKKD